MKVIILAGGYGTRLGNITETIPKPMVKIGGKPIIWHIMKIYSTAGYNDFIISLGYKGEVIKEYFFNYNIYSNDFTTNKKRMFGKTKRNIILFMFTFLVTLIKLVQSNTSKISNK